MDETDSVGGTRKMFRTIKGWLKCVLPLPVKSFMREVNFIKQALECLNQNILNQVASYEQTLGKYNTELVNAVEQVQLKTLQQETNALKTEIRVIQSLQKELSEQFAQQTLQQETDALKTEIQVIQSLQKEFAEQFAQQSVQQTALIQAINQSIAEGRKQTDSKITAMTRRCNMLDDREKRLLQDKRYLEQIILHGVPNFSSIALELTNHCAYDCFFCPRDQMTRTRGIMSDESIHIVARRLGAQAEKNITVWTDGMGEALLLDDFFDKIHLIKSVMPNAHPYVTTTLGYQKDETYWDELLRLGIRRLQVSIYGYDAETYRLLHGVDRLKLALSNLDRVIAKNEILGNPVEIQVCIENFGREFFERFEDFDYDKHLTLKKQFVSRIEKHTGVTIFKRKIHNRGQAFQFANPNTGIKRCFIDDYPTRKNTLYVTWNLNVLPCPMIFNDEIVLGNLKEQSLEEIYHGEVYKKFISSIQNRELQDYPSCRNCSD